jgi:hypothetical protein
MAMTSGRLPVSRWSMQYKGAAKLRVDSHHSALFRLS